MSAVIAVTEPAAAYAASRCLAARLRDEWWVTSQHPSRCGWCDYPTDVIDAMVRRFNELVDFDVRNHTSSSGAVTFGRLERSEQLRQITAAQGLEDVPPPSPRRIALEALVFVAPAPAEVAVAEVSEVLEVPAEPDPEPLVDEPAPSTTSRPAWFGGATT